MDSNGPQSSHNRVEETLRAAFAKQDYYEAHQIYKSLNFRYQRQKRFGELAELLFCGSVEFFHLNIIQSGIDLARLFAEALDKGNLSVSPNLISKIATLYRELPLKPESERFIFLTSLISWSRKNNPETKAGHVALHDAIARVYLEERNYPVAIYHFVRSLDPTSCVSALQRLYAERNDSDSGMSHGDSDNDYDTDQRLAGMAVLEFLALHKYDLAKQLFVDYVSNHRNAEVRSKCYNFPVLALVSAVLSLCSKSETGNAEEFNRIQKALCEIYSDNSRTEKLLSKIGQHYIGGMPVSSGGPLQGLLGQPPVLSESFQGLKKVSDPPSLVDDFVFASVDAIYPASMFKNDPAQSPSPNPEASQKGLLQTELDFD